MSGKVHFLASEKLEKLQQWMIDHQFPKFRAKQVHDWVCGRFISDPDKMKNLPADLKQALKDFYTVPGLDVELRQKSKDGTVKLLLKLHDGEKIEMVVIPSEERTTFCLSTQVGCPVRCHFCASGRNGLIRNLDAGEMIEQLLLGAAEIGRLPDNIVFMGIGEGLLNFDELAAAIDVMTSPEDIGMSVRRLTVSTSGYVPGIRKLADLKKELTLAISLHAPNDEIRARLIPEPLRFSVAEIMKAADYYRLQAGRMVTLEYTLLDGINDSTVTARELAILAGNHYAKVNLIPFNATGTDFRRPPRHRIEEFAAVLEKAKVHVTIRQERGADTDGACGQLVASVTK